MRQSSKTTQNSNAISIAKGYGVEVMPGRFGAFKVYNDKTERYIVDCRDMTCDCPDFQYNQYKPNYLCKHLTGIRNLVAEQIPVADAAYHSICDQINAGVTMREKARLEFAGQKMSDLAWDLNQAALDLWGSAAVVRQTERRVAA